MSSPPLVDIVDTNPLSKGLIAIENIVARTWILQERPTFSIGLPQLKTLRPDPLSFLSSLSYDQLNALIAIPPTTPSANPSIIHDRLQQLLPVFPSLKDIVAQRSRSEDGPTLLHFPFISRARHSCLPNAVLVRRNDGSYVLQATRHIPKGSQIYLSYLPPTIGSAPYEQRQRLLKLPFLHPTASSCFCTSCQLPPAERQATDEKRSSLYEAIHAVQEEEGKGRSGPLFVAETVERIVDLVETVVDEPSLHFFLVPLSRLAAQLLLTERDYVRALEWAWFSTKLAKIQGPEDVPRFFFDRRGGRSPAVSLVPLPPQKFRRFVHQLCLPPRDSNPSPPLNTTQNPSLIHSIIYLTSPSSMPDLETEPKQSNDLPSSSSTTNVLDPPPNDELIDGASSSGSTSTLTGDPVSEMSFLPDGNGIEVVGSAAKSKLVVETDASDPSLPPSTFGAVASSSSNPQPLSPSHFIPGSFPLSIPIVPSVGPSSLDPSSAAVETRRVESGSVVESS